MVWLASPTTQVAAIAEPQLQQPVLQRRDVLVLVDREVPVLLVHGSGDAGLGLEHSRACEQHVLEVELAAVVLELLVGGLQLEQLLRADAGDGPTLLRVLLDGEHRHLAPFDLGGDVAQGRGARTQAHGIGRLTQHPHLVVDDRGRGVAGEGRPEEVQLRERCTVERAGRDAPDAERAESSAQLSCRLRGEGHGHDARRRVRPRVDAMRDAVRDHPGLPGAGAGEHGDGSAQHGRRLPLPFVESVERAHAGDSWASGALRPPRTAVPDGS
jgi:hypothetical protein